MLGFAGAFLLNPEEAEEIVQIVFISVWEHRKSLDPTKSFGAYLYQSIKNRMLNKIRDAKRMCDLSDVSGDNSLDKNDIERQLCLKEITLETMATIKKMPKTQQKVFLLSRVDGFSNPEIAKKLSISIRTVEHHIYQAKKCFVIKNFDRIVFFTIIMNNILS
ncbi:RNA polymerase ECF-type sigma factor [Cyclobacterium qasimii M12-11B]|nr:RNA polymerase ECF-type sigma factor [Cyclobacterium qasimii M12-11B]